MFCAAVPSSAGLATSQCAGAPVPSVSVVERNGPPQAMGSTEPVPVQGESSVGLPWKCRTFEGAGVGVGVGVAEGVGVGVGSAGGSYAAKSRLPPDCLAIVAFCVKLFAPPLMQPPTQPSA